MSILLYEAPIWAGIINAKEYWRTGMVLVQQKAALRCVSAYSTVTVHRDCFWAGRYTPDWDRMDKHKRVYRATCWISLRSESALQVRCDEMCITLCKWEEWLSESLKGEYTHLLRNNLEVWLERGNGRMDFYLNHVTSHDKAFSAYLFHMRLVENPKCANWDRKRRDDNAWHTLFIVQHFNCTRKTRWPPYKIWVNRLLHQTVWS